MTVTKADLVYQLVDKHKIKQVDAKKWVDDFFTLIGKQLLDGKSVKLSGFGNFELKKKAERPGRNPKTGEVIPVSARTVVTFKAGQKLKDAVTRALKKLQG